MSAETWQGIQKHVPDDDVKAKIMIEQAVLGIQKLRTCGLRNFTCWPSIRVADS